MPWSDVRVKKYLSGYQFEEYIRSNKTVDKSNQPKARVSIQAKENGNQQEGYLEDKVKTMGDEDTAY